MKKRTVQIYGELEMVYDENSPEFKESLSCYITLINSDGDVDKMLEYVASQLNSWGDHEHMIEGVGYVGLIDRPVPQKDYSGIQVPADYGVLEYEIDEED